PPRLFCFSLPCRAAAVHGGVGRPGRTLRDNGAVTDGLFAAPVPGREAAAGDEGPSNRRGYDAVRGADAPVGAHAPLAVRMRPRSLDEVLGQSALLGPGAPLRRLVEGGGASSVLLYGPPGIGKTTLAMLVASAAGRRFAQLSALSAGVAQ